MTLDGWLRLHGVGCSRGGRELFAGISLALGPGEAALVTGPNGAGKSSLLRIAAGLLRPSAGRAERSPAALLGEAHALDPELPLARALDFWARLDGRAGAAGAALEALGLTDLAPVPVRFLSTGQRRRAALASVVASGAPLWLLDEPANGLDRASLDRLAELVARHRATGGTAVLASHLPLPLPGAIELRLGG